MVLSGIVGLMCYSDYSHRSSLQLAPFDSRSQPCCPQIPLTPLIFAFSVFTYFERNQFLKWAKQYFEFRFPNLVITLFNQLGHLFHSPLCTHRWFLPPTLACRLSFLLDFRYKFICLSSFEYSTLNEILSNNL